MQSIIFGAGNIGRGFIGQLFSESGYDLTMVDIDQVLLDSINLTNCYTIQLVDNDNTTKITIHPVRGINSSKKDEVIEVVKYAGLGATAVGARVLPQIAPLFAEGMICRYKMGVTDPLNILVCENLKNAAHVFREMINQHLSTDMIDYTQNHLGLVDTVIGRMVPPPTQQMRAQDPGLIIVEPFKELPVDRNGFIGTIPKISGMKVSDNFPVYTARKLYIHNCGHAVLAYLGFLHHYEYGYEALADTKIHQIVSLAMQESKLGIVAQYHAQDEWLDTHIHELLHRFSNRVLGDTIFRLGRDPIRKLSPEDRLVAPARLALNAGVVPEALSLGIAAAYSFNPDEDPLAIELQSRIHAQGFEKILFDISSIHSEEPLGRLVVQKYFELKQDQAGKI